MEKPERYVGCCGAYCKSCKSFIEGFCKGCKLGYSEGKRDINKAKCIIKRCCFGEKKFETCVDCSRYSNCEIIQGFYSKNGFKYKKYREALEFVRANGYQKFLEASKNWRGAYGKLK